MSEVAKVLDVMGQLTRIQNDEYKIVKGVDYITDGTTMELKLRPAYARYVRYQRGLGMEVLFDTDRAFQAAMGGTRERSPPLSMRHPHSIATPSNLCSRSA